MSTRLFVTCNYVCVYALPAAYPIDDATAVASIEDGYAAIDSIEMDLSWVRQLNDMKQQFAEQTSGCVGSYFVQSSSHHVNLLFVATDNVVAQVATGEVVASSLNFNGADAVSTGADALGTVVQLAGEVLSGTVDACCSVAGGTAEVCGAVLGCVGDVLGAVISCLGD